MKKIALVLWLISLLIIGKVLYASQFGAGNVFGTASFGSGITTTSTILPGIQQKIIIGGGIVSLDKKYRKEKPPEYMLYDKLLLEEEEEKWQELQD